MANLVCCTAKGIKSGMVSDKKDNLAYFTAKEGKIWCVLLPKLTIYYSVWQILYLKKAKNLKMRFWPL